MKRRENIAALDQLADRLGVCRSTVYQLCERGEIRHLRVSNAIRVPVEALPEYLDRLSKKEPMAEGE